LFASCEAGRELVCLR